MPIDTTSKNDTFLDEINDSDSSSIDLTYS